MYMLRYLGTLGYQKILFFLVISEYYLINDVKFSAIYVLTTSPLVSDNRVLVRKKSAGE